MRGNKKNSGLVGVRIIGVFMIAARRLGSRANRRQTEDASMDATEHIVTTWENQELWRRRLNI